MNDAERNPAWAKSPGSRQMLRGHVDELVITVEAMPDSDRAQLRVTRAS